MEFLILKLQVSCDASTSTLLWMMHRNPPLETQSSRPAYHGGCMNLRFRHRKPVSSLPRGVPWPSPAAPASARRATAPPKNRGHDPRGINTPRAFTRDTRRHKRLSMPRETTWRDLSDGRPGTRPRHRAGPPRETSTHATRAFRFGSQNGYARRQTRTPDFSLGPCGRGVHSSPAGAPVSRAPLEVGRAKRVSNSRVGFRFPEGARYPSGAL